MIGTMPRLFKTFAVLAALFHALAAGAELPRPVLQALKTAGIPAGSVGVVVQEVGAARPTLVHEAHDSMNPASVMKLVTTYAAQAEGQTPDTIVSALLKDIPVRQGVNQLDGHVAQVFRS